MNYIVSACVLLVGESLTVRPLRHFSVWNAPLKSTVFWTPKALFQCKVYTLGVMTRNFKFQTSNIDTRTTQRTTQSTLVCFYRFDTARRCSESSDAQKSEETFRYNSTFYYSFSSSGFEFESSFSRTLLISDHSTLNHSTLDPESESLWGHFQEHRIYLRSPQATYQALASFDFFELLLVWKTWSDSS